MAVMEITCKFGSDPYRGSAASASRRAAPRSQREGVSETSSRHPSVLNKSPQAGGPPPGRVFAVVRRKGRPTIPHESRFFGGAILRSAPQAARVSLPDGALPEHASGDAQPAKHHSRPLTPTHTRTLPHLH